MLYIKRKYFDNLGRSMGEVLAKLPISANQWTLTGMAIVLISFILLVNQSFLLAGIVCLIASSVDMIDGAVARAKRRATVFGAYLDTIVDRLIEFIVIFGLFLVPYPDFILPTSIWLFIMMFGSLMVTYTKAAATEKRLVLGGMKGGGLLEHPDRMLLITATIIASHFSMEYASYLIAITTVLIVITAVQRFVIATKR
ncbi:MAG: CDP-alcohol phosphatidyltransferase family protein [Candidatus Aenigmarchaeota archaeon]|nr:CDP-alcohol phosphatidyltransferase family protein [Candidatus Aenigmarchaeota archaeon]